MSVNDAAREAAARSGEVISDLLIPRPVDELKTTYKS